MLAEWAELTPGERWKIFITGCVVLATLTSMGVAMGRTLPVKQTIEQEVVKIEKVKRVVVPIPSDVNYPPLKDPKQACGDAPVVIIRALVNSKGKQDVTFFTVRPAGDAYTVQCYKGGDYSELWDPGELVVLNGHQTDVD